ncbi:MAG: hypothetical protein LBK99_03570 [Opitutaceae bacterium]|nr:hypothetical protein [Opitutaceae bacterium]
MVSLIEPRPGEYDGSNWYRALLAEPFADSRPTGATGATGGDGERRGGVFASISS